MSNFYDDMVSMQKTFFENQLGIWNSIMGKWNQENSFNPMEEYQKFIKNMGESYSKRMSNPMEPYDALSTYKGTIDAYDRVYEAWKKISKGEFKESSDKIKSIFDQWNEELLKYYKTGVESYIPSDYVDIFKAYNMDEFIKPWTKIYKDSLELLHQENSLNEGARMDR